MTDVDHESLTEQDAPAGFRLGEPIALQDLLALPPDRRRWGRDGAGKLCLVSPESVHGHMHPIGRLVRHLNRSLELPWEVLQEPSLALPVLRTLSGHPLPDSQLGPRSLEPDVGVFRDMPVAVPPLRGKPKAVRIDELALAIEVLSDRTFRADLGLGAADEVDRWRSYLESGVPELWLLDADVGAPCPLPPRSGLFLRNAGDRWAPLEVDDLRPAAGSVHGVTPVAGGRVRSTVPGLVFDLDAFWAEVAPPA